MKLEQNWSTSLKLAKQGQKFAPGSVTRSGVVDLIFGMAARPRQPLMWAGGPCQGVGRVLVFWADRLRVVAAVAGGVDDACWCGRARNVRPACESKTNALSGVDAVQRAAAPHSRTTGGTEGCRSRFQPDYLVDLESGRTSPLGMLWNWMQLVEQSEDYQVQSMIGSGENDLGSGAQ